MKEKRGRRKKDRGISLLLSIVLIFGILGVVVFSVSRKISVEMSASAIQNLSESLELIKCTVESIMKNEADFQMLIAGEVAAAEDPEEYIRSYEKNRTMVKMSLIFAGETEGISNTGESFSEGELDFSAGKRVNGLLISGSYLNYMGTWAYTMKCPVEKDGREIAALYVEYVYDSLDDSLPDGFYDRKAMLYIMDAASERFVLKPKGMGMRSAGHLNLEDFYRANNILDEELRAEVDDCLQSGSNILFYHDIRGVSALNYMWAVNGGSVYLIGYVPVEAIQQEGRTVNQYIFILVAVMLIAFFLCFLLYWLSRRQQEKVRREQEEEREIHSRRLAEALQAAQIASNSKTMFLSNMSHDIRTPMNAVLGFATLLTKDADKPDKVREYTRKIMASGRHLLSLINDILDVSKIESGKVVLSVTEFALSDLVSSVDAIIRPMANEKKQKFRVEVTGIGHEYLMGDETRINQILINLLSNAVKYTPAGGNIELRIVGLRQRSAQYEHIRIEVEDDGYGMTPEYLEKIFDAFTRAENSTTNKVQGTGLGMAITKNIVELMGGTIDVFSEVNKGSTFRVELELRIPESQADRQFWEEHGLVRILSVDGDADSAGNLQTLMSETGVRVDTVSCVEEALKLTEACRGGKEKYDLILLDWDTARPKNADDVEKMRTAGPEKVPLMFLTSYDGEDGKEICVTENTAILVKPFFVSALKEKLREMQEGRTEEGDPESSGTDSLEGLRFLAAEDNEINAEILSEILSAEGAVCEIVENGKQAVERFERATEEEFDVILMDVQMPVMNGYDATRAIRALNKKGAAEIPIIAMTANAFAEDEKEALDAGMNVHVAKPIDMELLRRAIRHCLKRKE